VPFERFGSLDTPKPNGATPGVSKRAMKRKSYLSWRFRPSIPRRLPSRWRLRPKRGNEPGPATLVCLGMFGVSLCLSSRNPVVHAAVEMRRSKLGHYWCSEVDFTSEISEASIEPFAFTVRNFSRRLRLGPFALWIGDIRRIHNPVRDRVAPPQREAGASSMLFPAGSRK